tara:strand:+ start:13234 stop:14322 length:1089 start_codon:yes stop_codon:yes gene_type:complete
LLPSIFLLKIKEYFLYICYVANITDKKKNMQDFYGFFSTNNSFLKVLCMLLTTMLTLIVAKKIFFKLGFVDKPNYRSSHKKPVALGAGIIIIPFIVFYSIFNNYEWNKNILSSLLILFLISIWDDIKNIKPLPRLFFHFIAIAIYVFLYLNPKIQQIYDYDKIVMYFFSVFLMFGITWFINAFNFMDGINGITSVEVISICLSLITINFFLNKEINVLVFSILIIVSAFCYFNWSPASIFLGDAGSIPLGFITIFLLLELALEGMWVAAIILPLYYLMDTGITLIKRVYNKKKIWKAHKEHYYQQAIQNGFSHSYVSLKLILINLGLFFLSFSAVIYQNNLIFFVISIFWCSYFMFSFSNKN